jgi:DNA-binding winged helix-turn-helix (wHTH) protein
MSPGSLAFGRFVLDPHNRQLTRDNVPVELSSRYLDALVLLAREPGQLVSKERFLEEIWKGVPVTDEVITQCIKTLRKRLGDEASNPRFIETVPKHGYRFIAPVKLSKDPARSTKSDSQHDPRLQFFGLGTAGIIGGGIAGVIGGLLYGFAAASQTLQPGTGAISVLLVVLSITILVAVMGGAGVGFGIAAAGLFFRHSWLSSVAGGAAGGLIVGAVVKLLGIDAFNLLFGASPGDITGAAEGAVLGGAVGVGAWLASRDTDLFSVKRAIGASALTGAVAGIAISLLGGRLMVGSLDLLVRQFSGSRLRLDQIGRLFGEDGFGEITQIVTNGLEGALFAASITGAILIAQRRLKMTG